MRVQLAADALPARSWTVFAPLTSPGTVAAIALVPATGTNSEVTFLPFSVTTERRISACDGAEIRSVTASAAAGGKLTVSN